MLPISHHADTLSNQLTVVTVELPHLHTATIQLHVRVGSRFESPADNGLSHFLEHMFFRGTERYPSSFDLNFAIERLGGTLDAETGRDYSMFQISLDPQLVGQGIALLAEIMARPLFREIDVEREIILEEINEDFDESGVEVCADEIGRRLIFGDHPLGYRITGPRSNVLRWTDEDVRRHYRAFYGAANMVLSVAGPVTRQQVVSEAERYLAQLPQGVPSRPEPLTCSQTAVRFEYVDEPGSQTSVTWLFRAVPEIDSAYPALLALLRVLDDGMSTRLHYRLCDQLGLAYSVGASLEPLHDIALLEIDGASAHAKVPALVSETLAMLDVLRRDLVNPAELDKAKHRYRYDIAASHDDAHSMASWFGGAALYGDQPTLEERIAQMDRVTREDIRAIAAQVLRPERLAVVVVGKLDRARRRQVREVVHNWR
jgi:predicted Zn-dependent peptidase